MRASFFLMLCLLAGCSTTKPVVTDGQPDGPTLIPPSPQQVKLASLSFPSIGIPGLVIDRSEPEPAIVLASSASVSEEQLPASTKASGKVSTVEEDVPDAKAEQTRTQAPPRGLATEYGGVFFNLGSAALTRSAKEALDKMPVRDKRLEVIGYADALGSTRINRSLSIRRADTVAKYLRTRGAKEAVPKIGLESKFKGAQFRKAIVVGL